MLLQKDIQVLKELGKQLAEIAALPIQQEKKTLWRKHNNLNPVRPMVAIDQLPWHEMDVDGSLICQIEDPFWNRIETEMRRTLYKWAHLPADMVVENCIRIPKAIQDVSRFGVEVQEHTVALDTANDVIGHAYVRQMAEMEDIQKIKMPNVSLNLEETNRRSETAHEIFAGILPVHMGGTQVMLNMWDSLIQFLGVEEAMYDLMDRPEFIHALLSRWIEAVQMQVDQYEALGLLDPTIPMCHCTYTYNDQIPDPASDAAHPLAKDCWIAGMAQIFVNVSPRMHEEFELEYAKRIYQRFGLVNYGCCEPLHNKIDVIRKHIPNVRKISVSPWADPRISSERLGKDIILCRKPNPTYVSGISYDWENAKAEIQATLDAARNNGTPVEFILKDISTLRYEPQRLWDWEKRVMELVMG